jgi:outer membrane protein OmpA-like peptidoglycan-associated protein
MKRILLCAALLAAPLAQAQWGAEIGDELVRLTDELDRLRDDPDVMEFAGRELALAEDYIEELVEEAPGSIETADIEVAQRLLARAERVAQEHAVSVPRREVAVEDDDEAWHEAARARADADEERERALAARLDAEHARNESARLREQLGEAQTRITDRGLVLTLGDVLFAVGKAELKPGATRTLDKLVAAMRREPATTVTIEGHTDSMGRHAYNVTLSQRRADAVRDYLAARGIARERIATHGLGPDYPVATNATEAGRQQNRRVEVLVQNEGFDE